MILSYNVWMCWTDNSDRRYWRKNHLRAVDLSQLANGRILIYCNQFDQPFGKSANVLGNWFYLVARTSQIRPLNFKGWKNVPDNFIRNWLATTKVSYMLYIFLQYLFFSMFLTYYIYFYKRVCIWISFVLSILPDLLISLYWN